MPLAANEPRERKGRPPPTPWARLLRHPALWAIVVNNFTFHYAFYVVMNWLPTYFDKARRRGRPGGRPMPRPRRPLVRAARVARRAWPRQVCMRARRLQHARRAQEDSQAHV